MNHPTRKLTAHMAPASGILATRCLGSVEFRHEATKSTFHASNRKVHADPCVVECVDPSDRSFEDVEPVMARPVQKNPLEPNPPGALPGNMRCAVLEKLDFLVRFWELNARHATVGEPLSSIERLELLSLLQLVTGDLRVPSAGPLARSAPGLPAQVIGDGTSRAVDVRFVTAAALLVTTVAPCEVGSNVIVYAADAVAGIEFSIPCVVRWVHAGTPSSMALVVDGIPTRNTFDMRKHPPVNGSLFAAPPRGERLLG